MSALRVQWQLERAFAEFERKVLESRRALPGGADEGVRPYVIVYDTRPVYSR